MNIFLCISKAVVAKTNKTVAYFHTRINASYWLVPRFFFSASD